MTMEREKFTVHVWVRGQLIAAFETAAPGPGAAAIKGLRRLGIEVMPSRFTVTGGVAEAVVGPYRAAAAPAAEFRRRWRA